MQKKLLELVKEYLTLLFCFIPFPLFLSLVLQKRKRDPKPLLGRQNWAKRRAGGQSYVYTQLSYLISFLYVKEKKQVY